MLLDAWTRALAAALASQGEVARAFAAYEAQRLPPTSEIVRLNRTNPPDAILREVYERTGDRPFSRIEDVISRSELLAITEGYKRRPAALRAVRRAEKAATIATCDGRKIQAD